MKNVYLLLVLVGLSINMAAQAQSWSEYENAMNKKDYSVALKIINDIGKEESSRDAIFYYKRAITYEAMFQYVYAVSDLTSALELDPNNMDYYALRGMVKQKFGDPTAVTDLIKGGKIIVSDVDVDIPVSNETSPNTFVLIIANENYYEPNISTAQYAHRDGYIFHQYCTLTLGIPESNIHYKKDVTRNQMRSEVRWLSNVANAYKSDGKLIVYYSGHGIPDERNQSGYILPSDGIANDPESGYALSDLYNSLGDLPSERIIVFIDACFSGAPRGSGNMTLSKGVAIKHKDEKVNGNVVVFTAAQGDETAYPYEKVGHGLFSYYLFKILKETGGDVSLGKLTEYVTEQVMRTSIVANGKIQTPMVTASDSNLSWMSIRIQ